MAYNPPITNKQFVVTADGWTPISSPVNCAYFGLVNPNSFLIKARTTADDELTERIIGICNGGEASVPAPVHTPYQSESAPRFIKDVPFLWIQSTSGSGVVTGVFMS